MLQKGLESYFSRYLFVQSQQKLYWNELCNGWNEDSRSNDSSEVCSVLLVIISTVFWFVRKDWWYLYVYFTFRACAFLCEFWLDHCNFPGLTFFLRVDWIIAFFPRLKVGARFNANSDWFIAFFLRLTPVACFDTSSDWPIASFPRLVPSARLMRILIGSWHFSCA